MQTAVHVLFQVVLADELSGPQRKRFALLQRSVARVAEETVQVVHVVFRSHDHLAGGNPFATAVTIAGHILLLLLLLQRGKAVYSVVIILAVHFGVLGKAGLVELDVADAAEQALLVPVLVGGNLHKVAVFDFLATPFADFLHLFAFDGADDVGIFR